jgi:hypothetical protein
MSRAFLVNNIPLFFFTLQKSNSHKINRIISSQRKKASKVMKKLLLHHFTIRHFCRRFHHVFQYHAVLAVDVAAARDVQHHDFKGSGPDGKACGNG